MITIDEINVLSAKGGLYQVPPTLYDYICITSDKKCYYNEAYPHHPQVMNKIAYFKKAGAFDGQPIAVSSNVIKGFYDKSSKNTYESSEIQKEIIDLFAKASMMNSSDVHIDVMNSGTVIYFRINGDLKFIRDLTFKHGYTLCKTMFMSMCDQAGKTFQPRKSQDARMKSIFLPDKISGVRISTVNSDKGFKFVCRLLKRTSMSNLSLKDLGYENFQIKLFDKVKSKKSGIVFIAAPTGSGKSLTLASTLCEIIKDNNGTKNVITIENPVEYEISNVIQVVHDANGETFTKELRAYATQTPIMADTADKKKAQFSNAMSSLMRLDPDIIMIGEIRDVGSLSAAIDASMTGHQVWTTIHVSNAFGITNRLLSMGQDSEKKIPKELICDSSIISSYMSQRLVKKICSKCSIPIEKYTDNNDNSYLERLNKTFKSNLKGIRFKGTGCHACKEGIIGQTVIAEIIVTDQKFMDLLLVSKYEAEKYWLSECGGMPMMAHGLIKVKRGEIDVRDLEAELEHIYTPDNINIEYFNELCK